MQGCLVTFPQMGSFEVIFMNKKIFSKLTLGIWPNSQKIVTKIQDILSGIETKDYSFVTNEEKSRLIGSSFYLSRSKTRSRSRGPNINNSTTNKSLEKSFLREKPQTAQKDKREKRNNFPSIHENIGKYPAYLAEGFFLEKAIQKKFTNKPSESFIDKSFIDGRKSSKIPLKINNYGLVEIQKDNTGDKKPENERKTSDISQRNADKFPRATEKKPTNNEENANNISNIRTTEKKPSQKQSDKDLEHLKGNQSFFTKSKSNIEEHNSLNYPTPKNQNKEEISTPSQNIQPEKLKSFPTMPDKDKTPKSMTQIISKNDENTLIVGKKEGENNEKTSIMPQNHENTLIMAKKEDINIVDDIKVEQKSSSIREKLSTISQENLGVVHAEHEKTPQMISETFVVNFTEEDYRDEFDGEIEKEEASKENTNGEKMGKQGKNKEKEEKRGREHEKSNKSLEKLNKKLEKNVSKDKIPNCINQENERYHDEFNESNDELKGKIGKFKEKTEKFNEKPERIKEKPEKIKEKKHEKAKKKSYDEINEDFDDFNENNKKNKNIEKNQETPHENIPEKHHKKKKKPANSSLEETEKSQENLAKKPKKVLDSSLEEKPIENPSESPRKKKKKPTESSFEEKPFENSAEKHVTHHKKKKKPNESNSELKSPLKSSQISPKIPENDPYYYTSSPKKLPKNLPSEISSPLIYDYAVDFDKSSSFSPDKQLRPLNKSLSPLGEKGSAGIVRESSTGNKQKLMPLAPLGKSGDSLQELSKKQGRLAPIKGERPITQEGNQRKKPVLSELTGRKPDSMKYENEKFCTLNIPIRKAVKKKITVNNEEDGDVNVRVSSSEPERLEIINPEGVIEANGSLKISLLFKEYPVLDQVLYIIFITKDGKPWQKIMLTANYIADS